MDQSSQLEDPENIVAVFTVLPHLARSRNIIMKVRRSRREAPRIQLMWADIRLI